MAITSSTDHLPGSAHDGSTVELDPDHVLPWEARPRLRELAAIGVMVAVADIAIYRGQGFAGLGLFFGLTPLLFWLGAPVRRATTPLWILGIMLVVLALRLLWYGSALQVMAGFVLLVAFAAALAGRAPYLLVVLVMASQTGMAGYKAIARYVQSCLLLLPPVPKARWLNIVLPLIAFITFSALFVLANPDVVEFLGRKAELLVSNIRQWFVHVTFRPTELLFWGTVVWLTSGLLRPVVHLSLFEPELADKSPDKPGKSPLFAAYRNTLATVICLFAAYLVFEFKTLWFREFPEGFYYAGYAHEGAAWLTVALGLATVILSLIFSRRTLLDMRVSQLRQLAWIWSLQNFLLSIAVYNRLFIYIGFNGMTRMRIVGLFGITLVIVGFCLVLWKIAREKNFSWLIHRQIWALAIAVFLYALTPVDLIATSYNVARVQAGDSSASMQIGVKEINAEGILALPPLLSCRDVEIREGAKALMAQHYEQLKEQQAKREQLGWTAWQLADNVALSELEPLQHHWRHYRDPQARRSALARFRDYAYQWY